MLIKDNPVKTGENYTFTELGPLDALDNYTIPLPTRDENGKHRKVRGKVFLGDLLGLSGMEISVNKMAAGSGMPFLHSHRTNEEFYIFLGGQGEFQVDGDIFPVCEGTSIRVRTGGLRALRNNGDKPLLFVVVQAKQDSLEAKNKEDGIASDAPVIWE